MTYAMKKAMYDSLESSFDEKDKQGNVTRFGTMGDVIAYINKTFGLRGNVDRVELR